MYFFFYLIFPAMANHVHWASRSKQLPGGGVLWPNHTVPFKFSEELSKFFSYFVSLFLAKRDKAEIKIAMDQIMKYTCVDFSENLGEKDSGTLDVSFFCLSILYLSAFILFFKYTMN